MTDHNMPRPGASERFGQLGLVDPDAATGFCDMPATQDLLFSALAGGPAHDPIASLLEGLRLDIEALAIMKREKPMGHVLATFARRLEVIAQLLARCDGREPMPSLEPPESSQAPSGRSIPAAPPSQRGGQSPGDHDLARELEVFSDLEQTHVLDRAGVPPSAPRAVDRPGRDLEETQDSPAGDES